MKEQPETARAGKAGETTAQDGAQEGAPAKDTLTAEGISSLLKSEFAKEAAEEPETPSKEGQEPEGKPEGEAGEVSGTEGEDNQPGEGQEPPPGEQEQEQQGEEGEGGTEEGDQTQAELPAELQAAIEQWETAGRGELPTVLQTLVDRRIGKLTSQREQERTAREAAEARAVELEARLEEAGQAAVPVVVRPEQDEKDLAQLERAANGLLSDAENYLDDTATEEESARVEAFMQSERLDKAGLKRRVRETARWLTQDLPQTRQTLRTFKAEEAKLEPEVRKWFPWLSDKATKEYGLAQEILKVMPDLPRRTPGHRMALGIYVLGLKELERMQKAATNGKAGTQARPGTTGKPPPKTPTAGSAAPRVAVAANGKERQEEAARQKLRDKPNAQNATELLKVSLKL